MPAAMWFFALFCFGPPLQCKKTLSPAVAFLPLGTFRPRKIEVQRGGRFFAKCGGRIEEDPFLFCRLQSGIRMGPKIERQAG